MLVQPAIDQVRINGTGKVYLGFFDSTGALILDPIQLFAGALDVPTLEDSGETSTISITCENPLISLNEAPEREFDDLDQQIYHPGDTGMSFVDALPNLALGWPAPAAYSSPYPIAITLSPTGADIAVGGTVTVSTTVHYSDGSTYTKPSGAGSGPHWVGSISSSNPKVATVDPAGTGIVTGRNPGTCSLVVRIPQGNAVGPSSEMRQACTLIVHS